MKKNQRVLREMLYRTYERGERFMSQKTLAHVCGLSLGTVNPLVSKLEQIGAIEKKPMGFRITDARRVRSIGLIRGVLLKILSTAPIPTYP